MADQKTYICGCGREHHSPLGDTPPGWEWRGSCLLCGDCLHIAAFEHGHDSAPPAPAPTPVRFDKGDDATSILLRSGVYLDLADPDCNRIAPIDIAAGLRQPRFSAQTEAFYTIAQHSLLVLRLVEPVAKEIGGEKGQALRWCALLHDAPEAFLHDITRPLKNQLPDYKRIEAAFEARFARAFGIDWNDMRRQIVKRADLQALAIEKRELFDCPDSWSILKHHDGPHLHGITIGRIWSIDEAEERFLEAFAALQQPTPAKEAA